MAKKSRKTKVYVPTGIPVGRKRSVDKKMQVSPYVKAIALQLVGDYATAQEIGINAITSIKTLSPEKIIAMQQFIEKVESKEPFANCNKQQLSFYVPNSFIENCSGYNNAKTVATYAVYKKAFANNK